MSGIEVERINGIPVARLSADIDAANAARVREELAECFDRGSDRVVLDLTTTAYLDSAGIDMLFRLSERLQQRRAGLVVVIDESSQLARLARIVGLSRAMPVHDTVEQALRALSASPGDAVKQTDV